MFLVAKGVQGSLSEVSNKPDATLRGFSPDYDPVLAGNLVPTILAIEQNPEVCLLIA